MRSVLFCAMRPAMSRQTASIARTGEFKRQRGLTLIELLVAMAISLVIVVAAAYVFLASREAQRAIDRNSSSRETGAFIIQTIGRELMNAGFYPATMVPVPGDATQTGMYDTYPPLPTLNASGNSALTDWQAVAANVVTWPPAAFMTGIYGCDGGQFKTNTSTCDTVDATKADTVVINYFSGDAANMASESSAGGRRDCNGSDPAGAASAITPNHNKYRVKTDGSAPSADDLKKPPQLPIFVSNRYTLTDLKMSVDGFDVNTKSLGCSGNGSNPPGVLAIYQPIVPGVEDLQFTYGVYQAADTYTPSRFYTATEVNALSDLTVNGLAYKPWQRVTAVRACVLVRTLGGNTRIADKAGAARTYKNCADVETAQPARDTITRFVQVFGLRNGLKQYY